MENTKIVTIITPTTGKKSLFNAIETLDRQKVPYEHILFWDDKREDDFSNSTPKKMETRNPYDLNSCSNGNIRYSVVIPGSFIQGNASGSSLRSVGLMLAKTEFVTFMDDDVMMEDGHLLSMLESIKNHEWCFCKRKIWTKVAPEQFELLGVDEFESVGEDAKTPYKMVDNNCMLFRRRFGVSAACIYRCVQDYCDDRLMYAFLMKYAGEPSKTGLATVNQICPDRLVEFFRNNCTKINLQ